MLRRKELDDRVEVDSAGTHGYHVGEAPDQRTQRAAAIRTYDLSDMRARKVAAQDLDYFDLILAMDHNNLSVLQRICPPEKHESFLSRSSAENPNLLTAVRYSFL